MDNSVSFIMLVFGDFDMDNFVSFIMLVCRDFYMGHL